MTASPLQSTSVDFDLIIAGGGMIGTSLALALAPLNLSIAVVEAVLQGAPQQPSFDDRSTALSRSSQRTFEALGIWPAIAAAATAIKDIHVSDKGHFGFSHINANEQRVEALGYVVINRVLGEVLHSALQDSTNVTWMQPARVTGVDVAPEKAALTLSVDGEVRTLTCSLLVAADGAQSSVRDFVGIESTTRAYGQRAIVGNLLPELSPEHRAFERFTSSGPLAILPLADDRAGFVWTVADHEADNLLDCSDAEFLAALQEEFGFRLGSLSRVGKRSAYPLRLTKARRITAPRAALVGNAAHGLHPAAAQGFNLGMRDVASLCDCIADALAQEQTFDAGGEALLSRYREWRKDDQSKLVTFTDQLVRVFSSERRSRRLARNLGMLGFDLVPGVRSVFAKHTMGLAGTLPRLSRGVPLV